MTAYLMLTITALFWGANAVAGKLAVGHISPFLLTSTRWGLACLAATIFAGRHLKDDWPTIRRYLPLLAGYGAIGFACFNALFYTAAQYTSAINIVIIQAGMPIVIFVISFILFRIRVTPGQVLGFLLTLTGILVVAANGSFAMLFLLHVNRGDALMLVAILFYGSYTAALRWKPRIHWLSFMSVLSAAAFIASLPFSFWELAHGQMVLADARGLELGIFTAIFPGLIGQAAFVRGTELIGSNRAGIFVNLVPIVGTFLSILVLGEAFHAYHAIALVLVMGGIAIAERRRRATPATVTRPEPRG